MAGIEESVREICQELDQAIRRRNGQRVEDFLASLDTASLSPELWLELIYTEFVARLDCGERPTLEEYQNRFPHLASDIEELFFLHNVVQASLERHDPLHSFLAGDEPHLTPAEEESVAAEGQPESLVGAPPFSAGSLGGQDASGIAKASDSDATAAETRQILGHYEILEEIGRGSTAVVYKARDLNLRRLVALKVFTPAIWGQTGRQRFLAEAQAAAALRHPHIVQIYEIGESGDSWYVAMEYLEGGSLADRPDKVWSPREAARTVATLARAVQYAHDHHILHRDLKPANVLLDGDGTPKIVDFGLAKRLDEASPVASEDELVGTPAYMAPEQTSTDLGRVGPATDVYALGAILYELLTGRPPFQGRNVLETLFQVRHQEPIPPHRLQPSVHRDLVTICLKCLEKDPRRRYPSAAAVADDLHRFLEGQVIWARPAGPLERSMKWLRRHFWAVLAVLSAALVLGVGSLGLWWYAKRLERIEADRQALSHLAERQAQELRSQEDASRLQRYAEALQRAEDLLFENPAQALAILDDPSRCPEDLRDFTWHLLQRLCHEGRMSWAVAQHEDKWVRRLILSPDGQMLVWGSWDGNIIFWDTESRTIRHTLPAHSDWISALAFSADGKLLASGSYDHTIRLWRVPSEPEETPTFLHEYRLPGDDVPWDLAMHPRGEFLMAATDRGLGLLRLPVTETAPQAASGSTAELSADRAESNPREEPVSPDFPPVKPGQLVFLGPPPANVAAKRPVLLRENPRPMPQALVRSVTISHSGNLVACGTATGRVLLFSWPEWDILQQWRDFQETVWSLDFSPDGTLLAGSAGGSVWLYNLSTKQARYLRDVHFHPIRTLQFSRDGRHFLTTAEDYTARVWDVKNLSQTQRLSAHLGYAVYGTFARDSRWVYTASQGWLNLWDLQAQEVPQRLENDNKLVRAVALSPDGTRLATVEGHPQRDTSLSLWDVTTGTRIVSAKQPGLSEDWLFFTGDGRWLVAVVRERQIQIRDAERLGPPRTVSSTPGPLTALTLTPNGRLVVAADRRGRIFLWDTQTWLETQADGLTTPGNYATALTFSPDGHYLLTGMANGQIILWDFAQRNQLATAYLPNGPVAALAVHPQGTQLAAVSRVIPAIQLFEIPGLKFLGTWEETPGFITYLTYTPDGQDILSATPADSAAGKVELRIWHGASGRCHATFSDFAGPLIFLPGGAKFLSLDRSRQIRLWPCRATPPLPVALHEGD